MPPLTIKADPSDLDEAAYHLGILPLDRQAPAVTGVPAPQPDQPSGALPSVGASGTGGALPPVPSASMGMGSPASADTMSTPPPSAASSAGAQMQLQRDTNSYKPFSQLGVLGKIGRIAGYGASALVPHVAGLIPQTPLGHIAQINQDTSNLRGAQQEERAQAQERSEEGARQSTEAYQQSEIDKNERDAPGKEPLHVPAGEMVQQPDGTWVQVGKKEATEKSPLHFQPGEMVQNPDGSFTQIGSKADSGKAPVHFPPGEMVQNPDGSFTQVGTPKEPEGPKQMAMVPQPDGTMKAIEIRPGTTVPKGATSLLEAGKEQTSGDAKDAAQQYADDYIRSKQFTGAGDEALMEKYFELAKPSSGFRMSQPQIEMLTQARDLMGGIVARGKHMFSPEAPYFSDTQRQQIVDTMKNIQRAGEESRANAGGSSQGGPAVGTVENGYKFKGGDPGKKENWVKQ